jgi:cyclic-di-AMP phosphodiesterase PgpH
MSGGTKQRNKKQRIDNLGIQKPRIVQWWQDADKFDASLRIGIAFLAAVILVVLCQTWKPSFAYRENALPTRDLVTRMTFEVPDEKATEELRQRERREELAFYRNRTVPLDQLRARLKDQLFLVLSAEAFEQLDDKAIEALQQFDLPSEPGEIDKPSLTLEMRFEKIKTTFAEDAELKKLDNAIHNGIKENEKFGIIKSLQHNLDEGSQQVIRVYREGAPDDLQYLELNKVRIAEAGVAMAKQIRDQFRTNFPGDDPLLVANMISRWLVTRMPDFETLTYDKTRSEKARTEAAAAVEPAMTTYERGSSVMARAGQPLTVENLQLLRKEWQTLLERMNWKTQAIRMLAYFGMILALYLLCGSYIFFVDDRNLILDVWQLAKLLAVMVAVVASGYWLAGSGWRSELIPITVGSILCSVVYKRELALLLMAAICVSLTLLLGYDIAELVSMSAAATSIVLLLGRIRTRTHLLWVGATSAFITVFTVLGVGIVTGESFIASGIGSELRPIFGGTIFDHVLFNLFREASLGGFLIIASAAAMTPVLPLIERGFGVQTDLSLLELGDASHALLRRLAQRAPGTYNHSINVASIAEAAADEIGANGLLVRVGSYFHDIGKMFKPEYFIENQSAGVNQHDSLQPAMSTLVIIAHVKDGADLARSHSLPQPIIDLILQHHGTTLVEYFYREAARRSEVDPNGESVCDKDFRYPGPKPQTLEAAVMMLADTVESASRTLVDPTPARIRHLVDSIAEKKMGDGQFDDCGMTFQQLYRVRTSLVKSVTAIYHARVKYPGQQSA